MKPSIGRIVRFRSFGAAEEQAAVIVRVHSDTCVNLRVLSDSSGDLPYVPSCPAAESLAVGDSSSARRSWPERT